MANGTLSSCGGNFYDSGNTTTTYGINENYTLTICSDVPGKCVSLAFSSFELENNFDFLYVYNGPSVSSPLLGTFTGTTSPGTITATSGCITIKFVSDYTVCKAGWVAAMSCTLCPVNGCPTCNGGIPPANDACANAQNLGSLPAPVACPSGLGQLALFNTSNICATPEIPYSALQSCHPIGNMAAPASDVWYKFTITAPILEVTINGMITPEVGLYSGSGCGNLVPRGCAIGGGGLLNTTFSGLSAGTYYLQVSGGTLTDQCNFTLSLQNNLDCQGCVTQSTFTATPPPVNGIYLAGQTVNFCLRITGYLPSSANWLHAVIPSFGPGWDLNTLAASSPLSCSGNGNWGWYNHIITSDANSLFAVGPGFFYETSAGNSAGVADTNPGNNFGDNMSNGCTLNFCFSIKTKNQAECIQGQNLNVLIDTYGDGESGSWTSVACAGDPVNDFYTNLACCIPPAINVSNPVCNGQLGSAIGTGLGSGPWTYQWKNAGGTIIRSITTAATDQVTNLAPGNYSLVTIDATGCDATTVFIVVQAQVLHAAVVVNDTKCALNNGSITLTATGGTSPYTYSNNNGTSFQASNLFRNLAAGVYNIVVKDAHLCTWDTLITVNPSTVPVIDNIASQNITCYNGTDGIIDIVASSGTPPYNYSIDNGATSQLSPHFGTDLIAGGYQILVTDAKGCTARAVDTLTQPPPVDLQVITTPASCSTNDGTIELNVLSGATGTLSYSISDGANYQSSNTFNNLGAGIYFISILDQNGCLTHDTAIVKNLNAPNIDNVTATNLTCNLSADGSINIIASGGTGTLQYSINNGVNFQGGSFFNSLPIGDYHVVIKDQNNCRAHQLVSLTQPLQIIIRADITNPTCGLSNGSMSVHPENGVLPLQFSGDGGVTWQVSSVINNLPSGPVTIKVRDANGCEGTRIYQIAASSAPTVLSLIITDVSCYSTVTGAITINAVGGKPPIQYSIDGGVTFFAANTFSALAAGNYNLVLKDNVGCSSTSVFNIAQPTPIVLNFISTDAECGLANGSITVTANGGTGIFTYSSDGGLTFGAANVFNNLPAGSYKVVVMDSHGCIEATTVIINDALGPRIIGVQTTPQICDGFANGSISLTVVSGTGALQYSIDNGNTFSNSPDFQNLTAGNYTLYVKDTKNCFDTDVALVDVYHSPQIDLTTFTDVVCNSAANGTIDINASGGNGTLQYSIDNGANYFSSNSFNTLAPGTYYVAVTDTNNCTAKDTVVIIQPTAIVLSHEVVSEKCNRSDGSINIHVDGGVPIYLFSLNNNAFNVDSNFYSLAAGNYTIVVMDDNECVDSVTAIVPMEASPVIDAINLSNAVCSGSADGSIIVNTSGGSGVLQYSIDNGFTFQTSNTFGDLASGVYPVSVVDTNNCSVDSIVTITEPAPFDFAFQSTNSNCNINNGVVVISVTGGTGALTYSFDSGVFSSDTVFASLGAGNYSITVKDAVGCTQDFVASVNNFNGPVIQSVNATDLTCNGINTGTISITANGGTGPLNYSIDNGASFSSVYSYSNLPPATYTIVVSDTAGCQANNSVTINQPDEISILHQTVNAACGQSNGQIVLSVSGGTGTYQYSIDSVNFQSSPNFNNLVAGTYQIVVKDANSCVVTTTISVDNLLAPSIADVAITNLHCYHDGGGEISVSANGGSGDLTYSIDNGNTFQLTGLFTGLPANTYSVIVSDINNCIADTVITLTEPDEILAAVASITANCNQSNGILTVNASGGTGALTYSVDQTNFFTYNQFNNLASGNYTVTVKDATGCVKNLATAVSNLNGPLIQSIQTTDLLCNGYNFGTIVILANGGSGNLAYSIDNGINFQSALSFSGLPAANYAIIIKDTAGCFADSSVTINQPETISVVAQTVNPACGQSNGEINLNASGGTGNLVYSIDSINFQTSALFSNLFAGTYSIVVHDANNCMVTQPVSLSNLLAPVINTIIPKDLICNQDQSGQLKIYASGGTGALLYSIDNGITFQASTVFDSLNAGTYYVTVKDINNCIANDNKVVAEPDGLDVNSIISDEICSSTNGSFVLSATGGTLPYLFSIDSGYVFTSQTNYSGLNEGNYNIVIIDNHGCKTYAPVLLNDLTGPTISNVASVNVSCFGNTDASIQLTAAGGHGTLLYGIGNTVQQDDLFENLPYGNYVITVTDTNGCYDTAHVAIAQPQQLSFSKTVINPTCYGSQDGGAAIVAHGGTVPYNIQWSSGAGNNFSPSTLAAGMYYFTITDAHNCSIPDSIFLTEPDELIMSHTSINGTCSGSANASATVSVTGGTTPYMYQWSPVGSNTNYANNLLAGNYSVTVTDANGCSKSHTIIISNPSPLAVQMQTSSVSCYNGSDGTITALSSGGTPPYFYHWHDLNSTESFVDSLMVGNYSLVVTDSNGCAIADTATLSSPSAVSVFGAVQNVSCFGFSDGTILLSTTGGVAPYVYNWNNGQHQANANNLAAGVYSVVIADANNCLKNISYLITQPQQVLVTSTIADTICIGQQSQLTSLATGGNGVYAYSWSNGATVQNISVSPSVTANYFIQVVDSNGCVSNTDTSLVFVHPPLQLLISPDDTICQHQSMEITANASGGNGGPYFYSWSPGNGIAAQVLVSPDSTTSYIVSVSDHCTLSPAIAFARIVVNPIPIINFDPLVTEGCMPLAVHFTNQTITPNGSIYEWNFDDGSSNETTADPTHVYSEAGSYDVTLSVTTPESCSSLLNIPNAITAYPLPDAAFTLDPKTASIFNPRIVFTDESSLASHWNWNFGNNVGYSTIQNPFYIYTDTGRYSVQLIVSSEHLCVDTAYSEVIITGEYTLYIPNTFTPNNDGKNDLFFAVGYDLTDMQLLIFNRWGEKVFEATGMNAKWNGKENNSGVDCPQDAYVYKLITHDLKNKKHEYLGKVNLIR